MTPLEHKKASPAGLVRLKPREAIAVALLTAFLLFLSLDLLQAAITNESVLTIAHSMGFVRGFIATAAGMLFVWFIMHRKEKELLLLRDHFSSQAHTIAMENQSLLQDFLSVISHRMRTPIRANALTARLMAEGSFGAVTSQQIELLQHLIENNDSVDRLLGMLVDIFNYKTASKNLSLANCRLDEVVRACVDKVDHKHTPPAITIAVHTDPAVVSADADELSKVVQHLIENAMKYGRQHISIRAGVDVDSRAFAVVADDGKGIPPEDVANLFSRFYQMSSDGKYAPATGVGLCLCSEIIKAHGGTISCSSTPNEGTQFTVRMPQVNSI